MAWLLFLLCFGFSGGGLFLLYLVVPLEQRLRAAALAQPQIDRILQVVVAGWVLASLVATRAFHRTFLQAPGRRTKAYAVLGAGLVAATAVFSLFLHTGSPALAALRGQEQSVGERFTFGPFPDLESLKRLKTQGYDTVVTLLSPAIPFERVLLEQEIANGKKLGLKVYSFPMLPWISDNAGALASIKALAAQGNQRIYFHCYLGKHRVLLVEQMLEAQAGQAVQAAPEPLPNRLERGVLRSYAGERILVGPYPTDEEWFGVILRHNVREVVVTLDPANPENTPWIDKARQIAQGYGMTVSSKPLDPRYPDAAAVTQIGAYVGGLDHTVFILGFLDGNWETSLDRVLSGNEAPVLRPALPDHFERGDLLRLGDRLLFGPYPTDDEVLLLKAYGVQEVVSLLDDRSNDDRPWADKEEQWATAHGLALKRFPLPATGATSAQVQAAARYLRSSSGVLYVHGFRSDERMQAVYRAARALTP